MNDVILLTTPSAEGMPIEKYFGLITANQVAGTGFFTDLTASLSDIFGGKSGAYRDSMNELCKDVTERLKVKALELGANGIVGVSVDYDSISAKGMSMFMVSIQGTAVKLTIPNEDTKIIKDNEITWDTLNTEFTKKMILRKINDRKALDESDWNFVQKNSIPDLMEPLFKYYELCLNPKLIVDKDSNDSNPNWATLGKNNYKQYLLSLEYKDAINYVYRYVKDFREIIEKKQLFNASKILNIAKEGNLDTAISLLSVEKASYNDVDLSEMKLLCEYLSNLPELAKKVEDKGSLFSSGGTKYVCSNCLFKYDAKLEYCPDCGKNIYGITKNQNNKIKRFEELVDTLSDLME